MQISLGSLKRMSPRSLAIGATALGLVYWYRNKSRKALDDLNQRIQAAADGTGVFLEPKSKQTSAYWKSISLGPQAFEKAFSLYLQNYGSANLPEIANMRDDQIVSVIWTLAKMDPSRLATSFQTYAKTDALLMHTIDALATESPRTFFHYHLRFPLRKPELIKYLEKVGKAALEKLIHENPELVQVYSEEIKRFKVSIDQLWRDDQFRAAVAQHPQNYAKFQQPLQPSAAALKDAYLSSVPDAGLLNEHEISRNLAQLVERFPEKILGADLRVGYSSELIQRAFLSRIQKNPHDVATYYWPFTYSLTAAMRKEIVQAAIAVDPTVKASIEKFIKSVKKDQWIFPGEGQYGASAKEIIRVYESALKK